MAKIYKTAMGKTIDMESLMMQHSDKVALGNMNVNAQGDRIGRDGKVITQVSEVVKDYYENNPKAIKKTTGLKGDQKESDILIDANTPKPTEGKQSKAKKKATVGEEQPDGSFNIIEEDMDGGLDE